MSGVGGVDSPATTAAIAAVIDAHTPTGAEGNVTCWCGPNFDSWVEHSEHVAAVILDALAAAGFSVVAPPTTTPHELRDCSVDGCGGPGGRRVTTDHPLCEKHYQQWRRGKITDEGTTHG